MSGNPGMFGFPSGNGLMDQESQVIWCGVCDGDANVYINAPQLQATSLNVGMRLRYVPSSSNSGPVNVWINGAGPFRLVTIAIDGVRDPERGAIVVNKTTELVVRANSGNGDGYLVELTNYPDPRQIVFASIFFLGDGSGILGNYNILTFARVGVGIYNLTFPSMGGRQYWTSITLAHNGVLNEPIWGFMVGSTRTDTGFQVVCRRGSTAPVAFDPEGVNVVIGKIT